MIFIYLVQNVPGQQQNSDTSFLASLWQDFLETSRRYKSDGRATSCDRSQLLRAPSTVDILAAHLTYTPALPSSPCHLWAAARWGSVSQLSLLPAASLKPAAGWSTKGETAWREIKWNLIPWLCANPSTEQLFILPPASTSPSQVSTQRDVVCQHVVMDYLVHCWSLIIHNFMTMSLSNESIIEGDGSGARNSGNERFIVWTNMRHSHFLIYVSVLFGEPHFVCSKETLVLWLVNWLKFGEFTKEPWTLGPLIFTLKGRKEVSGTKFQCSILSGANIWCFYAVSRYCITSLLPLSCDKCQN